jgi:hypothetical protein
MNKTLPQYLILRIIAANFSVKGFIDRLEPLEFEIGDDVKSSLVNYYIDINTNHRITEFVETLNETKQYRTIYLGN